MGTAGSDVAIETADIALAADDLRNVSSVVQISRQTMSVVRQNYGLALGDQFHRSLLGCGRLNQSNYRGSIAQPEHDPGHRKLNPPDQLRSGRARRRLAF